MLDNLDSALVKAAESGSPDAVARFLDQGADPMANGAFALRVAAMHGHTQVVKLLLPSCAPSMVAVMALNDAARYGHIEVAKLLLPVSNPKAYGSLPLRSASESGHLEIVKLLLPLSCPKSRSSWALRLAADYGHLEIAKVLLPFSDCATALKSPKFTKTSARDILLSISSVARAKRFVAAHPDLDLPRTRAMLAAENLRKRTHKKARTPGSRRRRS